jgi:hypothetical protein
MKKANSKPYKKMEFAQKVVILAFIFSALIVIAITVANFILLWTERQPMTQETITAITTYGGITSGLAFSSYATLNAIRTWSLNKHCNGTLGGENNGP